MTGSCDMCMATDVAVVRTYLRNWTPVLQCEDVDACWDRRRQLANAFAGIPVPDETPF